MLSTRRLGSDLVYTSDKSRKKSFVIRTQYSRLHHEIISRIHLKVFQKLFANQGLDCVVLTHTVELFEFLAVSVRPWSYNGLYMGRRQFTGRAWDWCVIDDAELGLGEWCWNKIHVKVRWKYFLNSTHVLYLETSQEACIRLVLLNLRSIYSHGILCRECTERL